MMKGGSLNKKICFISHNATRTGAPIVLYQFVKWMKEHHSHFIEVWFIEGGEMQHEFEALCPCRVLPPLVVKGLWKRGVRKLLNSSPVTEQLKELRAFDLVFFNTAASLKLIHLLPMERENKYVLWLHEQPFSINSWYKEQFTSSNLLRFQRIVCVSSQTKKYLEEKMGIDTERISIVHPFIDVTAFMAKEEQTVVINTSRPFVVGGCGLQDWRKGPDLFLQAARKIKKGYPEAEIEFVWVGGESGLTGGLQYELEKLELQNMVRFEGAQANMAEWFSRFDVFLLTSREDPFPLVVLEATAMEKPVICFEGIGDITQLIGIIPENVVSYGDVEAICERVMIYYNNGANMKQDGLKVSRQIFQYNTAVAARLLFDTISAE